MIAAGSVTVNRWRSAEDGHDYVVDHEGRAPGEHEHVEELHGGPLPAVGFAADYGDGGRALHGEGEEDHEGERAAEGHVVVESGLEGEGLGFRVGAVESAHGGDHDFAGEDAREQADADLPVEAERGDNRLNDVAEFAD